MHQPLPSYAFNASAVGFGGVIRQGNRTTIIPSLASVCLASAGGEASNRVDYYDRDGISFTCAETRVGGYTSPNGKTHSTFAEVLVLNLRVFERISIARMHAIVTSEREIEFAEPLSELEFDRTKFWMKLIYHGVEIDGEEIDARVDTRLCEAGKYRDFARELHGRNVPREPDELAAEDFSELAPETKKILEAQRELKHSPVNAPLVRIRNPRAVANRIPVPGFGKASFGDAIVKPDRQRVSLIRLSLGSEWTPESPSPRRRAVRTASILADHHTTSGTTSDDGSGGRMTSDGGTNGVPIWP